MSWAEVKKINSDLNTPLNYLMYMDNANANVYGSNGYVYKSEKLEELARNCKYAYLSDSIIALFKSKWSSNADLYNFLFNGKDEAAKLNGIYATDLFTGTNRSKFINAWKTNTLRADTRYDAIMNDLFLAEYENSKTGNYTKYLNDVFGTSFTNGLTYSEFINSETIFTANDTFMQDVYTNYRNTIYADILPSEELISNVASRFTSLVSDTLGYILLSRIVNASYNVRILSILKAASGAIYNKWNSEHGRYRYSKVSSTSMGGNYVTYVVNIQNLFAYGSSYSNYYFYINTKIAGGTWSISAGSFTTYHETKSVGEFFKNCTGSMTSYGTSENVFSSFCIDFTYL